MSRVIPLQERRRKISVSSSAIHYAKKHNLRKMLSTLKYSACHSFKPYKDEKDPTARGFLSQLVSSVCLAQSSKQLFQLKLLPQEKSEHVKDEKIN